jgi:hypothetical protein
MDVHGVASLVGPSIVMPGLVPGIHVLCRRSAKQDVDGRDEPGYDEDGYLRLLASHCHGKRHQIKPEQLRRSAKP